MSTYCGVNAHLACLVSYSVLNVKEIVGTFNQEKARVKPIVKPMDRLQL